MPLSPAAIAAELVLFDVEPGRREPRAASRIPVIVLAPGAGCTSGTDLSDLAARLGVALAPPPANDQPSTRVRFGRAWLDLETAQLSDADGRDIPLTAMEFSLLKLFARNPGRVLNRDQILEGAHDRPWDPFDRSIDIRISRIRRKVEVNPAKPEAIRTVRGIGYIYEPG